MSRLRAIASEARRRSDSMFNNFDKNNPSKVINLLQPNKSISEIISELQCSIKKLELKLRLVDGEDIEDPIIFNTLIFDIKNSCGDNETTENFINEMKKKREDNKKKAADDDHTELIEFFNFYLPSLSLFAAVAISYLSSIEITPQNIIKSTTIFNIFILNFIKTIKPFIEDSATYVDLYSKAFGLYSEDINKKYEQITVATAPISTAISKKSKIFYNNMPQIFTEATKNITNRIDNLISNSNKKKLKTKLTTPQLTMTFTMFSVATYIIILFMCETIGYSDTKEMFTNITLAGRGNRITNAYGGKKVKKTKKFINRKII